MQIIMWDGDYGLGYSEPTNWTDVAQICLSGHITNDSIKDQPQLNKKFCPECGEATITACPNCKKDIAGEIHYSNVFGSHSFKRPSFCIECGKAYPWTLANIKTAKELAADLEEISKEDRDILEKSIDEVTKDTSQAQVGATRIKKIISKLGETTGEIVQKVIIEVASETAKKIILGK